jgi:hypothetical protein
MLVEGTSMTIQNEGHCKESKKIEIISLLEKQLKVEIVLEVNSEFYNSYTTKCY